MIPADTDPAAHAAQMEAYRRMSPERRVEIAAQLSDELRQIALAGIRSRHPEYDEQTSRRALLRILLGDELVSTIWPNEALVAP